MKSGRGKYNRKQNSFSKKDHFLKSLIRQTVYSFHQKKIAPKRYAFNKLKRKFFHIKHNIQIPNPIGKNNTQS